ncbi:MAG: L-rhamnose mutarotase [Lachnoclostridium sp.]|nr:L-rhamnose mutarotase [Lachnoclostridium sp.]
MKRYIQTLDLVDDPELIAFYKKAHDEIWPEIVAGIQSVGITTMDIYMSGTRLVMILEMPDDVDKDEAFARLATLPRQQEWEEYVGRCQVCRPGDSSSEKWHLMEKIFALPSEQN